MFWYHVYIFNKSSDQFFDDNEWWRGVLKTFAIALLLQISQENKQQILIGSTWLAIYQSLVNISSIIDFDVSTTMGNLLNAGGGGSDNQNIKLVQTLLHKNGLPNYANEYRANQKPQHQSQDLQCCDSFVDPFSLLAALGSLACFPIKNF